MAKRTTTRAGVYCRISSDRAGDELGVDRQREDCEKLAATRGWSVAGVFVDDDRSAYSGRPRPAYERLLDALRSGAVDAVVAWHPDRLHRSPVELEGFIDVVNAAGAAVATCQSGEVDLSTASGRMTARVVGAVARHESEQKSERIRRQREQMALQGRPQGGGRRAYGYDATGAAVIDTEATFIREAASRCLAGESLRAIATDWNTRGIRSSTGRDWTIVSLRTLMTGPRLAALRVHRGEVVGPATWPAILTREEHDALRARLGNPRTRRQGRPPTSLLGGMIRCARCGKTMHASRYTNGTRRYICAKSPGKGGCGGTAIQAERTEAVVVELLLRQFDTASLAASLAAPAKRPGDTESVVGLEARLAELADLFAAGDVTRAEWMRARDGIEKRLAKARADRDHAALVDVTADYAAPGALRAAWPTLTVDERRAVLAAVIDTVTISPAPRLGQFDGDRIAIDWRT